MWTTDRAVRALLTLLTAIVIGLTGITIQAQDAPIDSVTARAETRTGEVPYSGTFVHTFAAVTGDLLTLTARAVNRDFDPVLTVRGMDRVFIEGNDNAAAPDPALTARDARIVGLFIPADGVYTVEVSGLNGVGGLVALDLIWQVDRGFTIDRERALEALYAAPLTSEMQVVTVGAWDRYIYTFDAQRGDVYTFMARALSGDIDPRIALYYEDSLLVDANDDHSSSDPTLARGDSRLLNVHIPRNGRYYLEVRGYQATTGEVSFLTELVARNALVYPGTDTVYSGELPAGVTQRYTLTFQVGDYVSLTVRAGDALLDPVVRLINAEGRPLIDNDNHSYNDADLDFFDARVKDFLIPASGTYTVEVSSARGGEGRYDLTVTIKRDRRLFDPEFSLPNP